MDIMNSQVGPSIVDDIFIEICKNLDYKHLLKLQLLSKNNNKIIRRTKWSHTYVKLINTNDINDKVVYLAANYNFMCYDFTRCSELIDSSVEILCNCHSLILSHCKITDKSVRMLGMAAANSTNNRISFLRYLDLSYCEYITDESVKMLGHINTLNLSNSSKITDKSIIILGKTIMEYCKKHHGVKCKLLHTLDLSYCDKITDRSIRILGMAATESHNKNKNDNHCCALRNLNLSYCQKITPISIITLVDFRTVNVYCCFNIEYWSVEMLKYNGVDVIMKKV
uniref:Leucine-rich repeat protein n=1 Tax=Pithovirus LCPAC101 TaxID=2506586 RepID=A0A481Z366_9VIRU|nr:MAG: leucine-rich repeat protein [Pithovirus LCPAC101]